MSQFTPAEIAAANEAFALHRQGKCPDDCGFCYDLVLSGLPHATEELKRIHGLRLEHKKAAAPQPSPKKKKQQQLPQTKRVGAGKGTGLKGRVKR